MPTTDERREVAARLREIANDSDFELFTGLELKATILRALIQKPEEMNGCEAARCIADLIEPEPVRVANITFTKEPQEELFQRVMEAFRVNGCPNCGAKVVE